MRKLIVYPLISILSGITVRAHCPLCTAGAAAAAGGALWLGVDRAVIALFLGAFAASTGWWVAGMIKRQFIPFQKQGIVAASFLLTIIPLLPIVTAIKPVYISLIGDYGGLLNRTYVVNISLITAALGLFIIAITPALSRKISSFRSDRVYPFQGIALTFILLLLAGAALQVMF